MRKKIVWLIVSCLMVVALLLASCGPVAVEEEEAVVTPEEEEVVTPEEEEVAPAPEAPKYGGEFILALGADVQGFDEISTPNYSTYTQNLTNEELTTGDWAKGPAGTGEASWLIYTTYFPNLEIGSLAESWEIPDEETIIFHIRKGVHFHDKPPVNGRELTADDVVFSFKRVYEVEGAYTGTTYPEGHRPTSITAPDKWTVVMKVPAEEMAPLLFTHTDFIHIVPHEMVEKYGNMEDWEASCGTGPFEMIDYVPMSSITFVRNPSYWGKDPLRPENTLPYLDSVKWLVIPDTSTRISALRTGKIDRLGVGWEDADSIMQTNPELQYMRTLSGMSYDLFMRVDKPELPFDDIRVRRALSMAIDKQTIAEDYYGGNAAVLSSLVGPFKEFMDVYTPLEELPESTRELFEYHPDRAKELLAEAGYPDGFATEIICTSGAADILSIVKADWEKIGVDLELKVRETAVWYMMGLGGKHTEMIYSYQPCDKLKINSFQPEQPRNFSKVNDPRCDELFDLSEANMMDDAKFRSIVKELVQYILGNSWTIPMPVSYSNTMWWPWVKGYHGESTVGYFNNYKYLQYIWLDQELKKEMGY